MNFLYPAFLLGALAIAIPVALHLLRRDVAPDLPFTAVRLLKKSPVDRSRRRRLRDMLLLAARVAALLLLAAAFARPFAPDTASAMLPLRIIAIDRSFSMGAPGRMERARDLARAAVDEAAFGERVAVIGFDERADVLAPAGSASDGRAAVDAVRAGYGGTRYAVALAKASELATGGPVKLVMITDLQRAGWEGESRVRVPSSMTLDVRDAGAPLANAAVVSTRTTEDGLIATVRNASAAPQTGVVTLAHEGREAARAEYAVPAHATTDVALRWKPAPGGVAVAIADAGGYPADNARHVVIGTASVPAVLVVTSTDAPGFYLQRALDAARESELTPLQARLVTPAEIAGGRAEAIGRSRGVVLLSTRSLDRAAREAITAFVKGGGGLFIASSPDVEPGVIASMFDWNAAAFAIGADVAAASLAATDIRHPIFRPFGTLAANLGQVRFSKAWRISAEGWHVAARFNDGAPALLDTSYGSGRIVLFASDLDRRWNDFPLHPGFVPFVIETLRHVASRAAEPDEFVVGRLPAGIQADPGLHRLESGRLIAVNVDSRESGTAVMTAPEFTSMVEPVPLAPAAQQDARDQQVEARQSLWQYGLLLMLGVLVVESFVGRA